MTFFIKHCQSHGIGASNYILLILIPIHGLLGQQWMMLALSTSSIVYNRKLCDDRNFLTDTQRQLCLNYGDLIPKVAIGAEMAYDECRHQFRWERWNCIAHKKNDSGGNLQSRLPLLFGDSLVLDSREAAFVSAIFSAGVSHEITKACSSNQLTSCSCDKTSSTLEKDSSKWQSCNDNIVFGTSFAKQFIDSVELKWSLTKLFSNHDRSLMNLHNNEAGRISVKQTMWWKCTCHGTSGSCTTKICSKSVANFRHIGNLLKKEYEKAIKVQIKYVSTKQVLMPINEQIPLVTNTQLVFLKKSPLYCNSVAGRRCKIKSSDENGSCSNMCCGKGYHTQIKIIEKNCSCKFVWCCKVTCQKCSHKQKIHICK
ncbi:protein Wnt-4 isoform X2 [Hydra vulgaris]|uniref:Protein Wnt n=1 Tax=Hydra vulgaris TaxID=6087 RepID=A0ABM4C368_HYDVU